MKNLIILILLTYSSLGLALDCENASSTPDINACGKIELDKIELELNQVYNRVLKMMDEISKAPSNIADKSKLKKSFVDAQRLWVKFREADCGTTYTLWSDGTIRGSMYLSCMMDRANKRIKELKDYEERP
ncbi:lysozyme inhibitor LprI family protein [Methylobacillus gramineus]|uniref:lysozyme inhibitor LprI family protein n=1 Tax=Methylobacillus gramineus TaxID=755169 RepID=UPI001CFFE81A|nr:lysozyme inhibitor LprI family protein [Methylobacillus gramineus]MCB5184563.1 lysozyme inhibitor LprI family protein [Methylobacillus gramineus]